MKDGRIISLYSILSLLTFFACTQTSPLPGEAYLPLADDGAWCWFSDPRAIYFQGKYRRTYAGWIDKKGNVIAGYYDHDSKTIKTNIVHAELEVDDHDNPGLFLDNNGKLWLTYSKHGGDRIYLVKAKNAEDISTWEPTRSLQLNDTVKYPEASNTYTYTNLYQVADEQNTLYLFRQNENFSRRPGFTLVCRRGKIRFEIRTAPEEV